MNDTEENTKKQKDIPFSWIQRINTERYPIFMDSKDQYCYNVQAT